VISFRCVPPAIAVADPIKSSTPEAIRALQALGLKVAMITGDNQRTANAIARQLGIDKVVAEVLPDGKVEPSGHLSASMVGSRMSVTASKTPPHWPKPMSELPSVREPTSP
jgi:cation transport ATPase